ncbi:MAG: acyl-CoA dehydratase activase [Dehalococcoidia bacterium]|nr:acyl-CoA dehydratase activase [Dehalococcoidia bacterium]
MKLFLGIDVGSVTTKLALVGEDRQVLHTLYMRTEGQPIAKVQEALRQVGLEKSGEMDICGVGTTGSARYLAGAIMGADIVKNEITAHAVAALHFVPDAQTVLEIGGQDSKVIMIRDGIVVDFGMNTVCAAGTGSFLDHQAQRLNMSVEEFGPTALRSSSPVRIAGRCTVFAESDMVHKQQMGHSIEDILYGLCQAMVRNYLNNVALGKELLGPMVFQGGVAFNAGIIRAFEEALQNKIWVPPHHEAMGAIGAAFLAQEEMMGRGGGSMFRGFSIAQAKYGTSSFECKACPNLCEIAQVRLEGKIVARWGGRCDLWERAPGKGA